MNEDLPRGPLQPLPAPDGAYDVVRRRAGARRLRRAGVAGTLSLALLAGVFTTAAALTGTTRPDALVVASPEPQPSSAPSPAASPTRPSPVASAAPVPSPTPSLLPLGPGPARTPASPAPSAEPSQDAAPLPWELTVVDAGGRPVRGAVLHAAYSRGELRATPVGDDGRLTVPCDGARYLVAMWDLRARQLPQATRNLAATWVAGGTTFATAGDVGCYLSEDPEPTRVTTVLQPGGVLTGRIAFVDSDGTEQPYATGSQPGGGLYCTALGLPEPDSQGQCANWGPVDGRYRFTGLPAGDYRLQGMYGWRDGIVVRAGQTTELDWYECDGCREGARPAPGPSPTP